MKNNLKLRQSNNLILATHEMNIQQMRLFFYACSQYKGNLTIEVPIEEIYNVLTETTGNRGGEQRNKIKKAIPTLMQNAIVHIEDEEWERWSVVFTNSAIKKGSNIVQFQFNKTIQKELEELRGYTWMYLSQLTGMKSTYSVRLYEFFAMRLGTQNSKEKFDFDINKLRLYLDCTKKYKRFDQFDQRVLKQAEKEINNKSNIKMSYKKIKTGRNITSIKFSFSWKSTADVINSEEPEEKNDFDEEEFDKLLKDLKEGTL